VNSINDNTYTSSWIVKLFGNYTTENVLKGIIKMNYKLHFEIPVVEENRENDYWVPLMKYFLDQSDNIEIHCWSVERALIEEMKSKVKESYEISTENEMTIFRGNKTVDIVDYLFTNLNRNSDIKWFSIFLRKNKTLIFSSEHNGKEYFAGMVNEKDIKFIESLMPERTSYNKYIG